MTAHARQPASSPQLLYAAFEHYPGHKGAHTHMRHILRCSTEIFPQRTLVSLGRGEPGTDPATGVRFVPIEVDEPNFLRRTERYGRQLSMVADRLLAAPSAVIHFRDIWSGIPLLGHPLAAGRGSVFEVNGLPSVELPEHYPLLYRNKPLLARLRRMEDLCLQRATAIVTVSSLGAGFIQDRGVDPARITVVSNPADGGGRGAESPTPLPLSCEEEMILYAGTLAPWQGIDLLLKALALLRHRPHLRLAVLTPGKKWVKGVMAAAERLGVSARIHLLMAQDPGVVNNLMVRARLTVAPLCRGARNEAQGCSPLKIVESMAAGTPVVAADLPVVRELVRHGADGWLVSPSSARALAAGIELLLDNEGLRRKLSDGAVQAATGRHGYGQFTDRMLQLYRTLMEI